MARAIQARYGQNSTEAARHTGHVRSMYQRTRISSTTIFTKPSTGSRIEKKAMLHVKLKICCTPHSVNRPFLRSDALLRINPAEMPEIRYITPHATGKSQPGGVSDGFCRYGYQSSSESACNRLATNPRRKQTATGIMYGNAFFIYVWL